MPHQNGVIRDPETGQFRRVDGVDFVDFEVVPFNVSIHGDGHTAGTTVDDYKNTTRIEGIELLDLSDILDRHRVGHLVHIAAGLRCSPLNNTADQAWGGYMMEISGSPALQAAIIAAEVDRDDVGDVETVVGDMEDITRAVFQEDTLDIPLRPLMAQWASLQADETNGVGAGVSYQGDEAEGPVPGAWDFDRRDELYVNGSLVHASDAVSPQAELYGTMSFGIEEA